MKPIRWKPFFVACLLGSAHSAAQTPTPPITSAAGHVRAPDVAVAADDVATAHPAPAPAVVATVGSAAEPHTTVAVEQAIAMQPADGERSRAPSYRDRAVEPTASPTVGSATRHLLRQQSRGDQAGQALPVLGASASLAHQRYLDSFKHPIPERFESSVTSTSSDSR